MKQCIMCNKIKHLDEFYKLSKARQNHGDGHDTRCKECVKGYESSPERRKAQNEIRKVRRKTDPEFYAKEKERSKKFAQTERGKELHTESCKLYNQTKKGKVAAAKSRGKYQRTEKYKKAISRYRAKFPEKRKAQSAIASGIQTGKIKRPSICSICGTHCIPEGHHPDYSKPLDVIWMCKSCHTDLHHAM